MGSSKTHLTANSDHLHNRVGKRRSLIRVVQSLLVNLQIGEDMEPVRFATIGTSHIAEVFLDGVSRTSTATISVVCSRSSERGDAFASQVRAAGCGEARVVCSLDEIAADPEVEAVYVATPNTLHFEQAMQMIEAGKHVLVEKPFTPTAAEANALLDAAESRGLVCMEAMRSLHDPGFSIVRDSLSQLGQVRDASIGYAKVSGRVERLRRGDVASCFDPRKAGGALMDLGCYMVEFAVALFGEPIDVKAAGTIVDVPGIPLSDPVHRVDLAGQALLSYEDKVVHVFWGKTTDNHAPTQIAGEEATLLVTQASDPRKIEIVRPAKITGDWGMGEGDAEALEVPETPNNISSELEDFAAAVRGTKAPVLSAADAAQVTRISLAVMDEIRSQLGVAFA